MVRPFLFAIFAPGKMMRTLLKRIYGGTLLAVLLAAYAGQKVHIYTEDPLRFPAFCGDPGADGGDGSRVVQQHTVDDYFFFPFLPDAPFVHRSYSEVLALLQPASTRCKQCVVAACISLRAPPVV